MVGYITRQYTRRKRDVFFFFKSIVGAAIQKAPDQVRRNRAKAGEKDSRQDKIKKQNQWERARRSRTECKCFIVVTGSTSFVQLVVSWRNKRIEIFFPLRGSRFKSLGRRNRSFGITWQPGRIFSQQGLLRAKKQDGVMAV